MKKRYPINVIFLIFLLGIVFILYPSIGNYITLDTASVTISDYEKVMKEGDPETDVTERWEKARKFNEHLFYGTNTEGEDKCLNVNDDVICYLDIPKISVYLPVYYGTSEEVLKKGCGYIENTSLPVGGSSTNSGISGHTGLPGAELLSSLDKLKEEDVFYIHVLNKILAYQVDTIKVVEPEETEDLEIVQGKDYVSLVTCTPYGINSHRLLVRGERVPYVSEEAEAADSPAAGEKRLSDAMIRQLLVIGLIIFAAAILVITAYIMNRRVKK